MGQLISNYGGNIWDIDIKNMTCPNWIILRVGLYKQNLTLHTLTFSGSETA